MEEEILPVVDKDGNMIGKASRTECHNGSFKLHPVVHLHLYSRDGRLLLQLRQFSKEIQPGKWDTSVGGHVNYGETIEEALRRETREELDVNLDEVDLEFVDKYVYRSDIEEELVYVYKGIYNGCHFVYPNTEIENIEYYNKDDINFLSITHRLTPNFESELKRYNLI